MPEKLEPKERRSNRLPAGCSQTAKTCFAVHLPITVRGGDQSPGSPGQNTWTPTADSKPQGESIAAHKHCMYWKLLEGSGTQKHDSFSLDRALLWLVWMCICCAENLQFYRKASVLHFTQWESANRTSGCLNISVYISLSKSKTFYLK